MPELRMITSVVRVHVIMRDIRMHMLRGYITVKSAAIPLPTTHLCDLTWWFTLDKSYTGAPSVVRNSNRRVISQHTCASTLGRNHTSATYATKCLPDWTTCSGTSRPTRARNPTPAPSAGNSSPRSADSPTTWASSTQGRRHWSVPCVAASSGLRTSWWIISSPGVTPPVALSSAPSAERNYVKRSSSQATSLHITQRSGLFHVQSVGRNLLTWGRSKITWIYTQVSGPFSVTTAGRYSLREGLVRNMRLLTLMNGLSRVLSVVTVSPASLTCSPTCWSTQTSGPCSAPCVTRSTEWKAHSAGTWRYTARNSSVTVVPSVAVNFDLKMHWGDTCWSTELRRNQGKRPELCVWTAHSSCCGCCYLRQLWMLNHITTSACESNECDGYQRGFNTSSC